MQKSARKIAQENTQLRKLLALHGVSKEKIDEYLGLNRSAEADDTLANQSCLQRLSSSDKQEHSETSFTLPPPPVEGRSRIDISNDDDEHAAASSMLLLQQQNPTSMTNSEATTTQQAHCSNSISLIPGELAMSNICPQDGEGDVLGINCFAANANSAERHVPSQICASSLDDGAEPMDQGLTMSCETAATIISDTRGLIDKESALASLGCIRPQGCNIKDTTALHEIDQSW